MDEFLNERDESNQDVAEFMMQHSFESLISESKINQNQVIGFILFNFVLIATFAIVYLEFYDEKIENTINFTVDFFRPNNLLRIMNGLLQRVKQIQWRNRFAKVAKIDEGDEKSSQAKKDD
ncbi:UNKNOWN [Stylonychia lemnae]|uniref:Uncharacterized protein n=1 Tax=Stylonychia lemnae TaxID=5949 RepID=A0A078B4C0_STYLE|nr:UNKNOWN [Stylonychia lemnae]|eukprot:CDW89101.1 UNKNOWN [Stylonychia lemnae]